MSSESTDTDRVVKALKEDSFKNLYRIYYNPEEGNKTVRGFRFESGALRMARIHTKGILNTKEIADVARLTLTAYEKLDRADESFDMRLVPVILALIKVHKYSTLGFRYGFNYIAYLGALGENMTIPLLPSAEGDDKSNPSVYPSHLRGFFAHGDVEDETTPGFAMVAMLLKVNLGGSTKHGAIKDDDDTIHVNSTDDYVYALEKIALENNRASPRTIHLIYGTRTIAIASAIPSESADVLETDFISRIREHIHGIFPVARRNEKFVRVEHESIPMTSADSAPSGNGNGSYWTPIAKACNWFMEKVSPKAPTHWDRTLATLSALEMADAMLLQSDTRVGQPDALGCSFDQSSINAQYAQSLWSGYDVHLPPALAHIHNLPFWPRPLPTSVGQDSAAASDDSQRGKETDLSFAAFLRPLTSDALYHWKTWLPPSAINLRLTFDDATGKPALEIDAKMEWHLEFDFENRAGVYRMMRNYLHWLLMSPKGRLRVALVSILEKKRDVPSLETKLIALANEAKLLERMLWFLAHFLEARRLQDELLSTLALLLLSESDSLKGIKGGLWRSSVSLSTVVVTPETKRYHKRISENAPVTSEKTPSNMWTQTTGIPSSPTGQNKKPHEWFEKMRELIDRSVQEDAKPTE